jgi:hypothetical protein
VRESVHHLFQTSLDTGTLPQQRKVAKIVPLKRPDKDNYTQAKAWRPILLLSTLEKLLEAVVAERISFAVVLWRLMDCCLPITSARGNRSLWSKHCCCSKSASIRRGEAGKW